MMLQVDNITLTRAQLETMNRMHRRELRQIKNMTEQQFQAFRRNFSFGHLDKITRAEAHELLMSMLALNLQLLEDVKIDERLHDDSASVPSRKTELS